MELLDGFAEANVCHPQALANGIKYGIMTPIILRDKKPIVMKLLLGLLVLLNTLDGALTHFLIQFGFADERNPFLARIVGEPAFMSLKVLGAVFCAAVLWDVNRRHPQLAKGVTLLAVLAYTVIVIWNLSIFWR